MGQHLNRRDFLLATGGAVAASTLLSSCSGSTGDSKAGDGKVAEIDVWSVFNTDEQKRYFEGVVAEFNSSQSDAKVRVSTKQLETIDQLLQTAMAAGKGPEIVPTPGPSYAANYVNAGQLLPLDELAKEYGWADELLPWALSTGTIGGKLYSIPAAYESMVLMYNPATFEANGWSLPTDRAAFEAICEEAAGKGMMPVAAGNAEWQGASEWHVTNVFNAAAGPEALFQALNGKLPWTDPVFVDAIALLQGWFDKGWFGGGAKSYFTNDFGPLYDRLAKGTAAMMVSGSWAMTEAGEYFGKNAKNDAAWEWAPLPTLSDSLPAGVFPLGVGATLSVNAKAESPSAAGAWIDFLLDPARQGKGLAEVEAQPYPVKLGAADFPAGVDDRLKRFYTELGTSTNVGYTTWTFWPPKSDSYIYREMDRVLLGDVSPADYCAGLDKVFQGELAAGKAVPVSKLGE